MVQKTVKLGNTRVSGKEQFYTPLDTARLVVAHVLEHIPHARSRTWLEPSAGTGAFVEALAEQGITDVIALDIEPHHPKVTKQDFLTWETNRTDLIAIGNPPFGRNNALSIPFFNHCATMCTDIAFIVPRSWHKWSVTNRMDMNFELRNDLELSINYVDRFGEHGYASNNLKTCLQVWSRTETPRERVRIIDNGFVSKCDPADADIAMKVFGYGCGKVVDDFERIPNTTMMFLKVNDERAIKVLRTADFSRYSTNVAYTQALAFSEINDVLNHALA